MRIPGTTRSSVVKLLLLAVEISVLFVLAEGILRLIRPEQYLPYHRNSKQIFYPSEQATPGVSGVSHFTTNSYGTRGPDPADERVRILTIGGSTTACTVLDDTETWPALLMQYLNEQAGDSSFAWVTNSGIDGLNSQHHIMHAMYLLPRLPKIDYVIVYAGLNDAGAWLFTSEFDSSYLEDPSHWSHRIGEAFRVSNHTAADLPWYKHLELWKRASIAKDMVLSRRRDDGPRPGAFVQDAELHWMEEARRQREEREKLFVPRAKMETLPAALDSYEDNIGRIVRLIEEAGARPILVAQAIQSQFLDADERRRLWMGAMDGGQTYVREEQLLELVNAFNKRMRDVADRDEVTFVDLPLLIEGKRDIFFDGVHFNERGARLVASMLAKQLEPILHPDPTPPDPAGRSGGTSPATRGSR